MRHPTLTEPLTLEYGTMPRAELLAALGVAGVELNPSASTLLEEAVFDRPEPGVVTLVERSVAELGLADGATLPHLFRAGVESGLVLCPLDTAPYLRLALPGQATAPDAVMSNGRAPSASLTIASPPPRADAEHPKGFYLRVVEGRPWLRGYRCDDEFRWDPEDSFVFALPR
ncbi:hypothetical protein [Frondihabitans cladoniiphilus]|uniref:Helicase n=1 Tax=Frondihabitans cladoniiphilus TaxID=715785 RepID=A0ABP8VMK1_9MICO